MRNRAIDLSWSFILDLENMHNPFDERKMQISEWKRFASANIQETPEIINMAKSPKLLIHSVL